MADPLFVDAKKGWSTYCRAGNWQTCEQLKARCQNPRHPKRAQTPPQPEPRRLAPAAPAATPRRKRVNTEPKIELAWEAPPEVTRGTRPLAVRLEDAGTLKQLRDKPNEWARLVEFASASAAPSAVKKLSEALPDFEWTARRSGTTSALYGRFVGSD